jgi:hypothetical protein
MKAASGIAFSALDQNSRVGFHTLWENSTLFTNVKDFTSANKQTWLTNVYKVNPNNGTPLPDAMWRVGELFAGNLAGSGPAGRDGPARPGHRKMPIEFPSAVDRRLLELNAVYTSRGNDDQTVPALANLPGATGFTPSSNFGGPTTRGPPRRAIAWRISRCTTGSATCVPGIADKVKDSVAPWQHLTTYSLSIGARGTISYPNGINAITGGHGQLASCDGRRRTGSDRRHVACGSQQPRQVLQCEQRAAAGGKHRERARPISPISRHRHGGRLRRRPAERDQPVCVQDELRAGIWGDVKKYAIDIGTGVLPSDVNGNPINAPLWSAATQIDAQAAVSGAVNGWDTQRRIDNDQRRDQHCGTLPPRQSVGRAADVSHERLERGGIAADRASGAQFSARRQVE